MSIYDIQKVLQITRLSPEPLVNEDDGSVIVYLYEDVTEESVNRVIKELHTYEGRNIQLHLKTCGGTAYDALALVDIIRELRVQVHVVGCAFSAGFFIFCSAPIRTMSKHATLMYHELAYYRHGDLTYQKRFTEDSERLQKKLDSLVTEGTDITQEQLDEIKERRKDWYIDYEEALALNIITHVLITKRTVEPAHQVPEQVCEETSFVTMEEYLDGVAKKTIKKKQSKKDT